MKQPMDLRTLAEKLTRGLYAFGPQGNGTQAVEAMRADMLLVWSNCRLYNPARASTAASAEPARRARAPTHAKGVE